MCDLAFTELLFLCLCVSSQVWGVGAAPLEMFGWMVVLKRMSSDAGCWSPAAASLSSTVLVGVGEGRGGDGGGSGLVCLTRPKQTQHSRL